MPIKSIKQSRNLEGKRALVRVDFNVPIQGTRILDMSRIKAALPTIQYLVGKNAKVILITHLGRPDGNIVKELSVDPIVKKLGNILKRKIIKLETGNWKLSQKKFAVIQDQIQHMRPGQIAMMENIRFSPDEGKNTGTLARDMASLADIFVLDGFAVAHRAAASVTGVTAFLPSYAGFLLRNEVQALEKLEHAKKPCVLVLGGAKIETKISVLQHFIRGADQILIGGGISNTYLKAKGYGVGSSLVDRRMQKQALQYCSKKNVIIPIDVVVGTMDGKEYRIVNIEKKPHVICRGREAIFDVGPKSIAVMREYLKRANTIVWNGAMGYFEQEPYHIGTVSLAHMIAKYSRQGAYTVIGGGETIQTMEMTKRVKDINHVSTGGGAMLEFLGGRVLPGIAALEKSKVKK